MDALFSLLMIGFLLLSGYWIGGYLPKHWVHLAAKSIGYWVLALLFVTGYNFGEHLLSPDASGALLWQAFGLALATTVGVVATMLALYVGKRVSNLNYSQSLQKSILGVLWEIVKVLISIGGGVVLTAFIPTSDLSVSSDDLAMIMLYALIFLVGIDLSLFRFREQIQQLSKRSLLMPWLVVVGSWGGGLLYVLLTDWQWTTVLALSSGFGWFSLSGVMVEQQLGPEMGLMALLVDLFREILAILLIVGIGRFHFASGVAVSGAAAMDSALPIIKNACAREAIPLALYSGAVLTICTPLLITLLLA